MKQFLPILSLFIAFLLPKHAGANGLTFTASPTLVKIVNLDKGSIGAVTSIVQDQKGFLWFAMSNGLFRYDGDNFKKISLSQQAQPFDLVLTDSTTLWIATLEHGLFKLDLATEKLSQFSYDKNNVNSIAGNYLTRMKLDGDTLWIASSYGLSSININTNNMIRHFPNKEHGDLNIKDIALDNNNKLWLATYDKGLYYWNINSNELKPFVPNKTSLPLQSKKLTRLLRDKEGHLWIGSFNGLQKLDLDTGKLESFEKLNSYVISSIDQVDTNSLWVGTWESGVIVIDLKSKTVSTLDPVTKESTPIKGLVSHSIIEDAAENLWLATSEGVFKSSKISREFHHFKHQGSKVCSRKQTLLSNQQDIWFSCDNRLYKASDIRMQRPQLELQTDREIYELEQAPNGQIWMSFYRSSHVLSYNPHNKEQNYFYPNTESGLQGGVVLDIEITASGEVWVSTYAAHLPQKFGALYLFNKQKQQFEAAQSKINALEAKAIDNSNLLLITPKNIQTFNTSTKELSPFDSIDELKDIGRINSTLTDSSNTIWFSVYEVGLFRYYFDSRIIEKVTLLDSVQGGSVIAMAEDLKRNLWLATNNTLFKYNQKNKKISQFTTKDGIQVRKFNKANTITASSGDIYLAASDGILMFNPEQLDKSLADYPTMLTDFKLKNKSVTLQSLNPQSPLTKDLAYTDELKLTYKDYVFSINFNGLHYSTSDLVYAYQLEGVDDEWLVTDQRAPFATYTTLPSGQYTFKVKSGEDINNLTSHSAPLIISIAPPPWFTVPAYIAYFIIILFSVYLFTLFKTRSITQRNLELKKGIKARTAELQQRKDAIESLLHDKQALFAYMSHEFRTPLTLILGPVQALKKQEEDERKTKQLTVINNNANRLLTMVDHLLDLAKVESQKELSRSFYSLEQTLTFIVGVLDFYFKDKNLSLKVSKFKDATLYLINDSLEKMLINLLTNAIKYNKPGGQIEITIESNEEVAFIKVKDQGIGIKEIELPTIFDLFKRAPSVDDDSLKGTGIGLALVKELAQSNGGAIKAESEYGKGSVFTLSLPITNKDADINISFPKVLHSPEITSGKIGKAVDENELSHINTELPSVLIIEDNRELNVFLHDSLQKNYRCYLAQSGEEGVEIAVNVIPDIILCDLMMPGISGFEVTKALKQNEPTCHIPIIMLTARNDSEARHKGWKHNIDDYIPKPFNIEELKLRLASLLNNREALKRVFGDCLAEQSPVETTQISDVTAKDKKFLERFEQVIERNYQSENLNRSTVANAMALSERQLNRKLSALVDNNFSNYLRKYRLRKSLNYMNQGLQVSQVSGLVGFSTSVYFGKCFRNEFGATYTEYEKQSQSQQGTSE
ncbi:Sensor histidine kinase RcsC [Pseudoalteromonas sp. CIP111854]|uniref:histidine kinase n=1 Tax=Pseudoalteromonas holothuriae TaxID=2963714 RepID=A0A9W4QRP6_9GAMM|nr:ATP-binding protein [Pseudoalteromonas sp. CIP111854]CAH9050147.1 Sensor histidine kinase RcsC [Pseudoalteromonas sp. CIP111854]